MVVVCPVAGSHSRMVASQLPVARVRPSGLNATDHTALLPSPGLGLGSGSFSVLMSQVARSRVGCVR